MLSPKMQRSVRVNDAQLVMLSDRAQVDNSLSGYLHKRAGDSGKWQQRWFILYQNLLFYYDSQSCTRPSGVVMLEGCYCERLITSGSKKDNSLDKQHYCFAISYRRDNIRQYELRASSETDCKMWIEAIREASFNKVLMQKEELEQKHLHLLQIVESEKTAKWQYTQRCEELDTEIKKLRAELCALKKELRPDACGAPAAQPATTEDGVDVPADGDTGETKLRKIKKVQSFFRGWLCRRRWKQIVEQYIKSPHAESMRKRNSLVFRMVEAEEEYMEQMEVLVSCFLRPFKMAASSKKPPCSHEDVNSIFLNSETVLFLHQIFLKGLTSRMESWPTLVLGDLFDMLLPMLSIYQEYVRNHHYSVQVLTECMKSPPFAALVHRLEEKPTCQGRSLATFLTYPMHQVPRYVTTLTDLLAHTPHDHVERKSLMNAQHQLEDLSRQMHDEVSETENLRKNLAVERMIVEGCDILLDVNQVFVRQGTLIQLPNDKRTSRSRLASFKSEKEPVRQCFLFSNHLIIATRCVPPCTTKHRHLVTGTRASNGRLHLVPNVGKIPLADAMLIEDPSDPGTTDDDESSICSMSSQSSGVSEASSRGTPSQWHNKDFKIVVDSVKTGSGSSSSSGQISVHLLAPTMQEKAAWISDITQCMDNVHFNDLLHMSISDTSSVTMPQSIKNDPKLFKDDVDIRFSRTQVNSCKVHGLLVEGHQVPQIRYATPERLLERLTDLRFLSIDFLNTFLLTYRVFTDSVTVLEALKKVFYNADPPEMSNDGISILLEDQITGLFEGDRRRSSAITTPRRVSGASSVSGYGSEMSDRSHSYDSQGFRWRANVRKFEEEHMNRLREGVAGALQQQQPPQQQQQQQQQQSGQQQQSQPQTPVRRVSIRVEHDGEDTTHLTVPGGAGAGAGTSTTCSASSSSETLVGNTAASAASSGSSTTLVPSTSTSPTPSVHGGGGQDAHDTAEEKEAGQGDKESEKEKGRAEEKEKDEKERDKEDRGKENKNSQPEKKAKGKDKAKDKDKEKLNGEESEKDSSRLGDRRPSASERRPSIIMTNAAGRMERRLSYSERERERRPSADNSSRRPSSAERRPSSCERRLSSSERRSPRSQAKRKSSDCGGGGGGGGAGGYGSWKRDSITTDPWTSEDSQDTPRSSARSASIASSALSYYSGGRRLTQDSTISMMSRPSIQHDLPQVSSKAGVVITSSRQSHRRSSTSTAAAAFAIATSASSNPRDLSPAMSRASCSSASGLPMSSMPGGGSAPGSCKEQRRRKESVLSTAATMRVLNVLRHWVSKHSQDFDQDQKLKALTIQFLEDIQCSPSLLPAEYKAAGQLLRLITKEEPENSKVDLNVLLAPPTSPSKENIETLSALEIAEQMTYLDHQIFVSICSEEFLGQAWIKEDKNVKAPRIEAMTKRFNQMSALVVSEIIRRPNITARVAVIEKWAAVADIARCLHNFNGVLQICAAFNNNVVFRLKKTWEKVSKTTKQTIDKLHGIVSSDGRFRNLREALHRCDPPCIPYLGMYLTDLSFIEESTPNFSHDKLLNFSKMRMIAHVIREVRNFQQVPYKIEHMPKVTNYLQDTALVLDEDEMYRLSLEIEPRASRLSAANTAAIVSVTTSHNRLFASGSHDR